METEEIITIRPKPRMVRFRKVALPIQFALLVLTTFLIALMVATSRHPERAIGLLPSWLLQVGSVYFCYTQLRYRRVERIRPVLTLAPEGFTVDGAPYLGPIPWDEIAEIKGMRFLFVPCLRITPKNGKALRARLDRSSRRWLWMFWMPKGLGVSCIPFSESPQELADRVRCYWQHRTGQRTAVAAPSTTPLVMNEEPPEEAPALARVAHWWTGQRP